MCKSWNISRNVWHDTDNSRTKTADQDNMDNYTKGTYQTRETDSLEWKWKHTGNRKEHITYTGNGNSHRSYSGNRQPNVPYTGNGQLNVPHTGNGQTNVPYTGNRQPNIHVAYTGNGQTNIPYTGNRQSNRSNIGKTKTNISTNKKRQVNRKWGGRKICFCCSMPGHVIADCWFAKYGLGTIAYSESNLNVCDENRFNALQSICFSCNCFIECGKCNYYLIT